MIPCVSEADVSSGTLLFLDYLLTILSKTAAKMATSVLKYYGLVSVIIDRCKIQFNERVINWFRTETFDSAALL
jgi:hypothetical protein